MFCHLKFFSGGARIYFLTYRNPGKHSRRFSMLRSLSERGVRHTGEQVWRKNAKAGVGQEDACALAGTAYLMTIKTKIATGVMGRVVNKH
jgi:hypothetical protein